MTALRVAAIVLTLGLAIAGTARAAGNVLDLGKPTNDVSFLGAFPLDGFHRVAKPLRSHGKVKLIFLGTQLPDDVASAKERWPVVKALQQFGTLSGVTAVEHPCVYDKYIHKDLCYLPSFDWSHAVYRSRYLVFDHKDLATGNDHTSRLYQPMSPAERALFYRYARAACIKPMKCDKDHIYASVQFWEGSPTSTHVLPLIAVGGYIQTIPQLLVNGDFQAMTLINPGTPTSGATFSWLSFDTIHNALVQGQSPPQTRLVPDVNAEANIITALICRADGKQPKGACDRSVIVGIMKQVK